MVASASSPGVMVYTGLGQSGDLQDPNNWAGDMAPSAGASVLFPISVTIQAPFTVHGFTANGNGTVTIESLLTATADTHYTSFEVNGGSATVFTSSATLHDAGGCLIGVDSSGALVARGNAALRSHLTTTSVKIGEFAGANGTATIDGAIWTDSQNMYVGQYGAGSLTVTGGGQVSVADGLAVGAMPGSTGTVSVTNGGTYVVADGARIGGGAPDTPGGAGGITVGQNSAFSVGGLLQVSCDGTLTLAGGTVTAGGEGGEVRVTQGGNTSGFGALAQTTAGGTIGDDGTITASGGTLALSGRLVGTGTPDIDANSTAQVIGAAIAISSIAFAGPDATLEAQAISSHATISGFVSGDGLLLSGATALSWDANHDVLAVSNGSQVVDLLHFTGNYAGETFSLTHADNEAVISVGPVLKHH